MTEISTARTSRIRRGAIGVLKRNDRYLMIRRAPGVAKGGMWCFPGGHLEEGETSRIAVVRELSEELGLLVRADRRVGSVRVLDSRHVLAVWLVSHTGGEIRLAEAEISEARWLTPHEILTIPHSIPSNKHVLRMLGALAARNALQAPGES